MWSGVGEAAAALRPGAVPSGPWGQNSQVIKAEKKLCLSLPPSTHAYMSLLMPTGPSHLPVAGHSELLGVRALGEGAYLSGPESKGKPTTGMKEASGRRKDSLKNYWENGWGLWVSLPRDTERERGGKRRLLG